MENRQDIEIDKGGRVVKERKRRGFVTSLMIFSGLFWVIVGIVLLLWAQDLATWDEALSYFLLGLGGVFLLDTVSRYIQGPRTFMTFRITISLLFLSSGLAVLIGISSWWPLIPILFGVGILLNALSGRK